MTLPFLRKKKKKVALALGSGSARGWAHIGVIKALRELGIEMDFIAGTSMGALVGSVHAAGKLDSFAKFVVGLNWRQLLHFADVSFSRSGLIDGKRIADFIREEAGDIDIEDLGIPFRAVTTDLLTGKEVVISSGNLIQAVRASISIPGIFTPVRTGKHVLVDGALVNPLPVSVARDMGVDFVIAVDVNHKTGFIRGLTVEKEARTSDPPGEKDEKEETDEREMAEWEKKLMAFGKGLAVLEHAARTQLEIWMRKDPLPGIFEVLLSSYNILEMQITEVRLKNEPADVLIRPRLAHIGFLDLDKAQDAIDIGYESAMEYATELKAKL